VLNIASIKKNESDKDGDKRNRNVIELEKEIIKAT
jgi:hypothetical protein